MILYIPLGRYVNSDLKQDLTLFSGGKSRGYHRLHSYAGLTKSKHKSYPALTDKCYNSLGYDLYYVGKGERRGAGARYRSEGKCSDSHTVGFRLLPRFSKTLFGELELAAQTGSEIKYAGQGYAGLTWKPVAAAKPFLTGACWILSGDSKGERGDTAWHAVFNRETGLGETIAPMYSRYNYTNLVYPHLAAGCDVGDFSKLRCQAGPLFTAVREDDSDGTYRGFYAQIKYELNPG